MSMQAAALAAAGYPFLPQAPMRPAWSPEPFRLAPLDLDDAPKLQRFFSRLDRDSLRRRFGHELGEKAVRAQAVRTLTDAVCAFGVFADSDLRGVIELHACATRIFEVALVVEHGWRRRGFASAMLRQAMRSVRNRGSIHLVFARDNWPMRALVTKANARLDLVFDEMCADIDLTDPRRES